MCHCLQSIRVASDTCAIECSESATTAIGYWNYSKNSFLLFDFLKISNPERADSGKTAEWGALKNEQSYLAEINTKQLTEELGRAADEAGRRADELGRRADEAARREREYFNSDVNKMANAVVESIKINNLQNHPQLEAYIKGLAEAAIRRHLEIDSSASDYNDYLQGIIGKVNLEL